MECSKLINKEELNGKHYIMKIKYPQPQDLEIQLIQTLHQTIKSILRFNNLKLLANKTFIYPNNHYKIK